MDNAKHTSYSRGMTLVEVIVVIGIISIALPALFSTLIVSTRQQVFINRINDVKDQGDALLSTMSNKIKNNTYKLCMANSGDTTCVDQVCDLPTPSAVNINAFSDRNGLLTRFYVNGDSIYDLTAGVVKRLTTDKIKVSAFTLQCYKASEATRPIVKIQYTIISEPPGNARANGTAIDPQQRASLDYSTMIIVDHIDPPTL